MSLSPARITTDRLVLTPLVEADAESMIDVFADERMYEFTGGRPPTLEELQRRYRALAVGHSADSSQLWFNWIVRMADAEAPVGAVQATVAADGTVAEVAWEVGVAWQGRGIASEAATRVVDWLVERGVALITANVHPDHAASSRVAERAGLEPTEEIIDGEVVWLRRRATIDEP